MFRFMIVGDRPAAALYRDAIEAMPGAALVATLGDGGSTGSVDASVVGDALDAFDAERPDGVIVASRRHSPELALLATECKAAVLLERPCTTGAGTMRLAELARHRGVLVAIANHRRHGVVPIRDVLGGLARIDACRVTYVTHEEPSQRVPARAILVAQLIETLGVVEALTGERPNEVSVGGPLEAGETSVAGSAYYSHNRVDFGLDCGRSGAARFDIKMWHTDQSTCEFSLPLENIASPPPRLTTAHVPQIQSMPVNEMYGRELDAFVAAVNGKSAPRMTTLAETLACHMWL